MPLHRICFCFLLAFFVTNVFADVQTRVWPSNEYTRFTIESTDYIKNDQSILKNPDRVVIDLKSIHINNSLKDLSKVDFKDNSSISGVRVAQYDPGTVRIVVDLRHESKIKIFSLKPFKSYGHRLVVDVYHEEDEIAHLLKQLQAKAGDEQKDNSQKVEDEKTNLTSKEESKEEQPKQAEQAKIVVAIDAGHGGGSWCKRIIGYKRKRHHSGHCEEITRCY